MKKALIVEDFLPIAEIWKFTLLQKEQFDVVEIISDPNQVEAAVISIQPDVLLMDVNIHGESDGIHLTETLIKNFPEIKIIAVTIHDEPHVFDKMMNAGAKGYVVKDSPLSELREAINAVQNGHIFVCDRMKEFI